jgi:peptidoglycan hydrolase-like protein with peptidoglycan-binding domain
VPEGGLGAGHGDSVLFARASAGGISADGMLVKILQRALVQRGLLTGTADGAYSKTTEAAVKAVQQNKGRVADGKCRDVDWEDITGLPAPSLFDRCLLLTAAYEGTGFEKAVGNFDGAFLTWGIIGYTLKHDLPDFLGLIDREYPGTLARAFGTMEAELRQIIVAPESQRRQWADDRSTGANRYGLRADWRDAFARLGSYPEVQSLQVKDARNRYWAICVRDSIRWTAADALDVALFFDTAVQNGGASRASIANPLDALARSEPDLSGAARRRRWAQIISNGSGSGARADVLARRMTMANGNGKVHGDVYNLANWGLAAWPVNLALLADEPATFMPATFTPAPAPTVPVTESNTPPAPIPPAPAPSPAPAFDLARDFKACVACALTKIDRPNLDRNWGPPAPTTVEALLAQSGATLPGDWRNWDDKRKAIALVQIIAKKKAFDPGLIDGRWGQATQHGFDQLVACRDTGQPTPADRPDGNLDVNPNNWPKQDEASMTAFYGPHGLPDGREPPMVAVHCPWPIQLSWEPFTPVRSIRIHQKCAPSLQRVLDDVYRTYGEAELIRLRLNQFGGCYNPRLMRGGSNWSIHSWAAAIDWDPDNNPLKWNHDRATFARPEYKPWWEAWEREGWLSLGRARDYDWMHIQAAKL